MASAKDKKKAMYSNPMDVRMLHSVLTYESVADGGGGDNQNIYDYEIEHFIYRADSIIDIYMARSGTGALTAETPYYTGPLYIMQKSGELLLDAVTIGSSAITEQWKIVFKPDSTFTVYGNFSGNQGDGTLTTQFVSTNGDLTIEVADWRLEDSSVQPADGDTIFIGVYISHSAIRDISSWIAAALLVDAKYTQSEQISSGWGRSYYKKAVKLLTLLADPDSEVSLDGTAAASIGEYEAVPYDITFTGEDATDYQDIEGDDLPY